MIRFEAHPSVVCTVLDDGGVLLHLETKYYYSLNPTGLLLWTLIEDGHPDPGKALAGLFPEESQKRDIEQFMRSLEDEKLVKPSSPGAGAGAAFASLPDSMVWIPPRLVRHDVPLNQIMSNPFDPAVPLAE